MKPYKKIDFFFKGKYIGSTNMSKTCKEAKATYLRMHGNSKYSHIYQHILNEPNELKAFFDKTKG